MFRAHLPILALLLLSATVRLPAVDNPGGWFKHPDPVLGGQYGTCFDICVLHEDGVYRMWMSWRGKRSIAVVTSADGLAWSEPRIVLGPAAVGWADDINRPVVLHRADGYHLWFTGQNGGQRSRIGYATSPDGLVWKQAAPEPVLSVDQSWEKVAVMNPHVLWDEQHAQYRMWYSGGENYEPNAIGHATSPDGVTWTKAAANPVFTPDAAIPWEHARVAGCQVIARDGWFVIFYIGYRDIDHAQVGVARSRDGLGGWQRNPANPIVRSGTGQWDDDACYKPFAICEGGNWLLWYNGRKGSLEQIGVVTHAGDDLGFPAP
ncbi:MAG: family 43 glycosylhydrolase [Planctomycetes bacterium]|nr:family 43 glycosylhydrolase [Planctomycetota bacterium]